MNKSIYITQFDMRRFQWLINNSQKLSESFSKNLEILQNELLEAVIVVPEKIPSNVITMHSTFKIMDLDTREANIYTLVFPFDADSANNKISVLSSIGVAVIGFCVDDIVEWESPSGKRKIEIVEIIYQPEREGQYYI